MTSLRLAVASLLPFATVVSLVAQSNSVNDALASLSRAGRFSTGPEGYAGLTPTELRDLVLLMKDPHGSELLDRLFQEGSTPGKLYALCGLYKIDHTKCKYLASKLETSKAKVTFVSGCVISEKSVSELLPSILTGTYTRDILQTTK